MAQRLRELPGVIAGLLFVSLLTAALPPEGENPRPRDRTPAHSARSAGEPWDRARLVDALERLIRTGEPRHVTHDEGEELQDALNEALAAGADGELRALATRAAAPIVTTVARPLSSRTTPGAVRIRADRVLTLPWAVEYVADVDVRVDGGPWRKLFRVSPGESHYRPVTELPAAAAATIGFHTVATRARIRYSAGARETARTETRQLATLRYGLWGSARSSDPVRPFFDAAASVSASSLDAHLPDLPFNAWLRDLPHARDPIDRDATDWHVEWCGMHESMSEEGLVPNDVCLVARRTGPERGRHTEVWIKAGTLRTDDEDTRWVRSEPVLVAAYVHDGLTRVRAPLTSIADLLSRPYEEWPMARLVVNAAGISIGAPAIVPNAPTPLRIVVANMGDADVHGIGIHVLAASEKHLPAARRTFVRNIRAGGSVEIETTVTLPAPYGIVDVMLVADHTESRPPMDDAHENHAAVAIVNPRAAPPGYAQRLCIESGRNPRFCSR